MAGIEGDRLQARRGFRRNPASIDEFQCLADAGCEFAVAICLWASPAGMLRKCVPSPSARLSFKMGRQAVAVFSSQSTTMEEGSIRLIPPASSFQDSGPIRTLLVVFAEAFIVLRADLISSQI